MVNIRYYVIRNFLGPNKFTGKETEYLTSGGKPLVYEGEDAIPPKFRPYAEEVGPLTASIGVVVGHIRHVEHEIDMKGTL